MGWGASSYDQLKIGDEVTIYQYHEQTLGNSTAGAGVASTVKVKQIFRKNGYNTNEDLAFISYTDTAGKDFIFSHSIDEGSNILRNPTPENDTTATKGLGSLADNLWGGDLGGTLYIIGWGSHQQFRWEKVSIFGDKPHVFEGISAPYLENGGKLSANAIFFPITRFDQRNTICITSAECYYTYNNATKVTYLPNEQISGPIKYIKKTLANGIYSNTNLLWIPSIPEEGDSGGSIILCNHFCKLIALVRGSRNNRPAQTLVLARQNENVDEGTILVNPEYDRLLKQVYDSMNTTVIKK